MSSSLAYSFGGGGTDRFDKEINLKPLFKKKTYVDPFKRLSWPKRGSRSRTNSVDSPTINEATTAPRNTSLSNEMTDSQPSNMRPQPSHNADTQLEISYHSLDSSSPVSQLSAILSLSNTIFNAQPDSTKYSSLSTWQTHLTSSSSSIVFFATIPCPDNNADVQPVGFIYAFPRTLAEYSDSVAERLNREETREVLHIWLCGILEKYRGKGVFEELMLLVERWAIERGVVRLSASTLPKKFGRMFEVLKSQGWSVVEEMEDEGKVVLMKDVKLPGEVEIAR